MNTVANDVPSGRVWSYTRVTSSARVAASSERSNAAFSGGNPASARCSLVMRMTSTANVPHSNAVSSTAVPVTWNR